MTPPKQRQLPAHLPAAVRSDALARLSRAGCVFPEEELEELADAARGDARRLAPLLRRRVGGEPLAWVTGRVVFCDLALFILPGVFVPRPQSQELAERACRRLPSGGRAVDLGTGCGAIASVLQRRHPAAAVIGTERDLLAANCARANGVVVAEGDLFAAVPGEWRGLVDVITAVLPYVPTAELAYLPRDVREFEPLLALDGGNDGLATIRRAVDELGGWLRPGGRVLFEIGGDQAQGLIPALERAGLRRVRAWRDEDGDLRGVEATAPPA
ncbi:MAG: N5-glutamine methyltransferase family protein [Candidatus Dormibacteria bacterium]